VPGFKKRFLKAWPTFDCKRCATFTLATDMVNNNELNIADDIFLETVDNCCYLCDMLGTDGGCSDAKLNRTEISMTRGFNVKEKSAEFWELLELESFGSVIRSVDWCGTDMWNTKMMTIGSNVVQVVDWMRQTGCPMKTWWNVFNKAWNVSSV